MDKEEIKKEAKQLEREGLSIKRQIEILELLKMENSRCQF